MCVYGVVECHRSTIPSEVLNQESNNFCCNAKPCVCVQGGDAHLLWEMSVDFIKGVLDLQKVKPTPLVMKI